MVPIVTCLENIIRCIHICMHIHTYKENTICNMTYVICKYVNFYMRGKPGTFEAKVYFIGIGGRLRQLEGLFIGGPGQGGRVGHTISIETLIDVLLVLYDECCNSSLRREKTVSDFIEFGMHSFLSVQLCNNIYLDYQYCT